MDPHMLDKYKAKQRDPVFIPKDEPRVEPADTSARAIRFAVTLLAVFALGFVAFFIFTMFRPF